MEFVPPLTRGGSVRGEQSYYQNVTGGWIAVGLKNGGSWPSFGHDADGTTLFLSSLKVNGGFNILEGPVPVRVERFAAPFHWSINRCPSPRSSPRQASSTARRS